MSERVCDRLEMCVNSHVRVSVSDQDQTRCQNRAGGRQKRGEAIDGLHHRRFNHLFADSHVAALRITDAVGARSMNAPGGRWTKVPGDATDPQLEFDA